MEPMPVAVGGGAASGSAQWSEVVAQEKLVSQAPWGPEQGSRFLRCAAWPSERGFSDGQVKTRRLPGRGIQGREGAWSAAGAGARLSLGDGSAAADQVDGFWLSVDCVKGPPVPNPSPPKEERG